MNKDSLIKAKEIIINVLDGSDIITQDKLELIINLDKFLNEDEYQNNIETLQKQKIKKWR